MTEFTSQHLDSAGNPPQTIDVLDKHAGFTACTKGGTLWRPYHVLKHGTIGTLLFSNPHSFYQTNDDVMRAWYKVPGYSYQVSVWFDNKTGNRIA